MALVKIDFEKTAGKIKPMHAVNNGPVGSKVRQGNSTYPYFKEAGIPYARNHDASFHEGYGGEYTVDVHRIFRNFDADPLDPKNYDFECTDMCVSDTLSVGTQVYYRLGSRIEHGKKVGTFPPKDYKKWAVICEHIIKHYNEGWADGFNYGITYWEIWNEPDCYNADGSNPCWQGTEEEFIEFFCVALAHLKGCFPDLKIGGPAFCTINTTNNPAKEKFLRSFFGAIREKNLPLDFFSFHRYTQEPVKMKSYITIAREMCDEYGYKDTEIHLNEWNYIRSFLGDAWTYSLRSEKGLKGASFTAGAMCVGQESPLDMLMYYDARPCGMNGMFDTDFYTPLKGYYPFKMFGELYRMGEYVRPEYTESPIYCTAAKGNGRAGIMVTNFIDDDNAETQCAEINVKGINGKKCKLYLLDEAHDMELVDSFIASDNIVLDIPLYSVYYIEIEI